MGSVTAFFTLPENRRFAFPSFALQRSRLT